MERKEKIAGMLLLLGLALVVALSFFQKKRSAFLLEESKTVAKKSPSAKAQAKVVVHVAGAVVHPGVYELPAGARVHEAIEKAGGSLERADLDALNLAAPLSDGEKVAVPTQGETARASGNPGSVVAPPLGVTSPSVGAGGGGNLRINLNTASQAELEQLPGVGKVTAERILLYRQQHGRFSRLEELLSIQGIGTKKFAKIKPYLTLY